MCCRFHGASVTFETDRYLVIVDQGDQTQHTISFALVSNTPLQKDEFDVFHTSRANHGIPQITKREVCLHLAVCCGASYVYRLEGASRAWEKSVLFSFCI
jgi:hypothetical protein